MAIEIRTVRDDEITAFREALLTTFGADVEIDAGGDAQHLALIGPGQSWAAFDGATIVGTAATFDLSISVPGGAALPMAGLTLVTVRPTHRRRGILRELMARHLADARDRGFAVSGLWASEAPIYRRFGYGLAAYCEVYEIAGAHQLSIATRDLDDVEWIDEARAREVLPAIYARATAERPGALRRTDTWWRERRFLETGWSRQGASKRRHVLARRGQQAVGYLVYRQRGKFTDGMPDGRLEINELIAVDPRAEATLWKLALSADLFPTVSWWNAPADDALPWLVDDMRRIRRRRADNLWLHVLDVPAALAARSYGSDGRLRMQVEERGRYELACDGGQARCSETTEPADLTLSLQALASLFLGCAPATQLARAELVRGDRSAIERADRMFTTALAPWCPEVF
jgi:predicted acetyltransferase